MGYSDLPHCSERCRIYANRVQYSRQYLVLYGFMIAVSLGLLVWVVIEADYPLKHPARWVFVIADSCVTAFILLELSVNMGATGCRRFWKLWSNWFDFTVTALCVGVLAMQALGPTADLEEEEEFETVILTCRYAAQITRLSMMIKNLNRQATQKELDIAFQDVDCVEIDDHSSFQNTSQPTSPQAQQKHDTSFHSIIAPSHFAASDDSLHAGPEIDRFP